MPKKFYKKIYLFVSALVGIDLILFLIFGFSFRRFAQIHSNLPVNFSFVTEKESVSPNINFQLLMDPRSYKISFVKVRIYFDPDNIQLAEQVEVAASPLSKISSTPLAEANKTGNLEIVMAQPPGSAPAGNLLKIANMIFKKVGNNATEITLVDEDTQVIGSNSKILPFTSNYAIVNSSGDNPQL